MSMFALAIVLLAIVCAVLCAVAVVHGASSMATAHRTGLDLGHTDHTEDEPRRTRSTA